jgi:hypothetical protein
MSFPGQVDKGMVVLDAPLPLPDGTPVFVEPVTISCADFWRFCALDDLAERQGVSATRSPDDPLGGWPPDELDDEFEQAFRHWRERELERHP